MNAPQRELDSEEAFQPPVDPLTFARGVASRWRLGVLGVLVSVSAALWAAQNLGKVSYRAEAILLHQPRSWSKDHPAPGLSTRKHMIKARPQIERVRKELTIGRTLESLAASFEVKVQRETSLLSIAAVDPDPNQAASMVRALHRAFRESLRFLRDLEIQSGIEATEENLARTRERARLAAEKLRLFCVENDLIHVEKQLAWSFDELAQLRVLEEGAKMEVEAQEGQIEHLSTLKQTEQSSSSEKAKKPAQELSQDPEVMERKLELLDRQLHKKRLYEQRNAELAKARHRAERLRKLAEKGLVPRAEAEEAEDSLRVFASKVSRSRDMGKIEVEIQKLEAEVFAKLGEDKPEEEDRGVWKDVALKGVDVELHLVSARRKAASTQRAQAKVRKRISRLSAFSQEEGHLRRQVESLEEEVQAIRAEILRLEALRNHPHEEFRVVSPVRTPSLPFRTNRKALAVSVAGAGILATTFLLLLLELLDPFVRSAADVEVRTGWKKLAHGVLDSDDQRRQIANFRLPRRWNPGDLEVRVIDPTLEADLPRVMEHVERSETTFEVRWMPSSWSGETGSVRWLTRPNQGVMVIVRERTSRWCELKEVVTELDELEVPVLGFLWVQRA